jgi:hypothetical protein
MEQPGIVDLSEVALPSGIILSLVVLSTAEVQDLVGVQHGGVYG